MYLMLSVWLAGQGVAQTPGARDSKVEEAAIRLVLSKQVEAWNNRSLEVFMEGYWKSPELTFFSGGRSLKGWDATIKRYRDTYQAEGREMGKLVFSDLDVQLLGNAGAVVRGRFELTMTNGTKPAGLFTLVLRKFGDGWKIVHDHTSSG
jgi:beta-aspartyl-peptidase (threonine type)